MRCHGYTLHSCNENLIPKMKKDDMIEELMKSELMMKTGGIQRQTCRHFPTQTQSTNHILTTATVLIISRTMSQINLGMVKARSCSL